MKELVEWVSGLGPTGLLGLALYLIAREYLAMRKQLDEEKAARLADAQANTTKMLELYDRLHPPDDDRRMSRHD